LPREKNGEEKEKGETQSGAQGREKKGMGLAEKEGKLAKARERKVRVPWPGLTKPNKGSVEHLGEKKFEFQQQGGSKSKGKREGAGGVDVLSGKKRGKGGTSINPRTPFARGAQRYLGGKKLQGPQGYPAVQKRKRFKTKRYTARTGGSGSSHHLGGDTGTKRMART